MSSPAHPASIGSSSVTTSNYQAGSDNPAAIASGGAASPEEVEAAIKIQKVVRGHLSRRNSEKVLGFSLSPRSSRPASPRTSAAEPPTLAPANTETNSNGAVEAAPRK